MNFETIDHSTTETAVKGASLEEAPHQFPPIPDTPEEILDVPFGASTEEIKRAYRNRTKLFHPDIHADSPDEAKVWTQALNDAYKKLKDRNVPSSGTKIDTVRPESLRERSKREQGERITEKEREIQDLMWDGTEILLDPSVGPHDERLLEIKQSILSLQQEVARILGMRSMQYIKQRKHLFEAGLAEHRTELIEKVLKPFNTEKEEAEARIAQIEKAIEARYQKHPLDKILRPDKISLKELERMLATEKSKLTHTETKINVTRHDLETRSL